MIAVAVRPPLLAGVQAIVERHKDGSEDHDADLAGPPHDEKGAKAAVEDSQRHIPNGPSRGGFNVLK